MNTTTKLLLYLFCSFASTIHAQDFAMMHLDLGGGLATHQNQTFSRSSLTGSGIAFQLGYQKQKENFFDVNLNFQSQSIKIDNYTFTESSTINSSLRVGWMKGIKPIAGFNIYLGGNLDTDFLLRNTPNLGNNQSSLLFNSTLAIAARASKQLASSNWYLNGDLSLGLLSWVKATDGYAFTAPQELLTSGEFSYDANTTSPFKYGQVTTIGKFNNINTTISLLKHGNRITWGVKYNWRVKSFNPFTNGKFVHGSNDILLVVGYKLGIKNKPVQN